MILVIDNYDSFVHNLARHFHQLKCETEVVRNDKITTREIEQMSPDAIVLSPGPCTPDEAGCSLEIVRHFHNRIPILGDLPRSPNDREGTRRTHCDGK